MCIGSQSELKHLSQYWISSYIYMEKYESDKKNICQNSEKVF
jgi:hypothetical protein